MLEIGSKEIAEWTGGEWSRCLESPMTGVSHDTRSIQKGELYIAIAGENYDGHRFVEEALQKGAAAAIVEKGFHCDTEMPLLRVADPRNGLLDLACGYRKRLKGGICAITGSVGKTTVKEMLAGILARVGPITATKGNWNNSIGLPLSLLRMKPDDKFGVFEVAMNQPGEIEELCSLLAPDCGIMTTVGLAHAEKFSGEEAVAREKAAMLASLPEKGFAILSSDEKWFELFRNSTCAQLVTVSLAGEADYSVQTNGGGVMQIDGRAADLEIRLPLPGDYSCRNAGLACAAALEMGVASEHVKKSLESFAQLPMRGEEKEVGGIRFVNDAYNANPVSMKAALDANAEKECNGDRWLILGEMHELGEFADKAHREIGSFAASRADWILTLGSKAGIIVAGAMRAGFDKDRVRVCADACEAAEFLHSNARNDDSVLLKGSRAEHLEDVLNEFKKMTGKC